MRIPALTCVVTVATLSVVSAAPAREETTERISYSPRHDHRSQPPITDPELAGGWVELASATPARHGREFIEVGAHTGAVTRLRLTAASGRPGIDAVVVDYKDGSHRRFEVNRVLSAQQRSAYLDLRGARELQQVIVISDRSSPGSYVLEANTAPAGVASR